MRFAQRLRQASLFQRLGPGLIAGAADDDPSGIATYLQAALSSASTCFGRWSSPTR
jgi:Mn2+/Fe2+ NRAMP family transporter